MKKILIVISALLLIVSFTSCDTQKENNKINEEENAESERVRASDADIAKVSEYWAIFSGMNSICEEVYECKVEIDFGDNGSLSITKDTRPKVNTFTANGEITIKSDVYVADNLVLACKWENGASLPQYTIEKGSITKNAAAMSEEETYDFLYKHNTFYEDSKCKAYTEEANTRIKVQCFDDSGNPIGNGTGIVKYTLAKGKDATGVLVYDFTINDSRIQVKMRVSGKEPSIDYVALNGVFYDKASCDKLSSLMWN